MALTPITYTDKTNQTAITDRTKQATADDFNEIKTVTNAIVSTLNGQYMYLTDPTTGLKVRFGTRDEDGDGTPEVVWDRELTLDGFNGTKGVNWEYLGGAQ